MARRLSGTVIIDGTDDENWPESDEIVNKSYNVQAILDVGQPAQVLEVPHVRWGGECRVEVRVDAQVVGEGVVQIQGNAKLFEGDTEDTTDLEDEKAFSFTVPRGGVPARHLVNLSSTGPGGGDHAEIKFSFTNSIVED